MVVVTHCVARQMTSIAERCKLFFFYPIFAFRLIRYDMSGHNVKRIQRITRSIFSMAEYLLINNNEIRKRKIVDINTQRTSLEPLT